MQPTSRQQLARMKRRRSGWDPRRKGTHNRPGGGAGGVRLKNLDFQAHGRSLGIDRSAWGHHNHRAWLGGWRCGSIEDADDTGGHLGRHRRGLHPGRSEGGVRRRGSALLRLQIASPNMTEAELKYFSTIHVSSFSSILFVCFSKDTRCPMKSKISYPGL